MNDVGKFIVIGILLMFVRHVDFLSGTFLLHGAVRAWPDALALTGMALLAATAAIRLARKQYLWLFFWLSMCFVLEHAVWYQMGQCFYIDAIPIRQSGAHFVQAWQSYLCDFGYGTIALHGFSLITAYLFFLFIAGITTKLCIVYQAMMKEIGSGR